MPLETHTNVSIDTSGAIFDDHAATEIARILREIAAKVETGADFAGPIFNSQGEEIGFYDFSG